MPAIIDLTSGAVPAGLTGLRTRLRNKGFQYLTDTECDTLLNEAYLEICDLADWPFLHATTSGPAPLTITDLGRVLSVQDTGSLRPLRFTTREQIVGCGRNPALAGTPCEYWLDGLTVVATWPVGGTVSVRYVKMPDPLSSTNLTPVIPSRFHDLIVTLAAVKAYGDDSDLADAQNAVGEYTRRIEQMGTALLDQSADTTYVQVGESGDW